MIIHLLVQHTLNEHGLIETPLYLRALLPYIIVGFYFNNVVSGKGVNLHETCASVAQ
jgi:hypothetical protein